MGGGKSQHKDDLTAFGLPADALGAEEEELRVWPENADTVAAFFACRTQWRIDGMSGRCFGLDYPGVAVVLNERALKGQPRRDVFDGIQIMEAAALEVMNKK